MTVGSCKLAHLVAVCHANLEFPNLQDLQSIITHELCGRRLQCGPEHCIPNACLLPCVLGSFRPRQNLPWLHACPRKLS